MVLQHLTPKKLKTNNSEAKKEASQIKQSLEIIKAPWVKCKKRPKHKTKK